MRIASIKQMIFVLLIFLIPVTALAIQPYKVVVFDFTTSNPGALAISESMSDQYREILQDYGRLILVSPERTATDSQNVPSVDLSKPSTREEALKFGNQLGADRIITGKVVQLGNQYVVYSIMTDIPTKTITAAVKVEGVDGARPAPSLRQLSDLMIGKLHYIGKVIPADSTDPADLVRVNLGGSTGFNRNEMILVERRLGYNWIEIGRMIVIESKPDYSLCQVTNLVSGVAVEPGDRARRVIPEDGEPAGIAAKTKRRKPRREGPLFTFKKEYASVLVPGSGQVWSNKGRNRGIGYMVLFLGSAYLWLDNSIRLFDAHDTFNRASQNYNQALTTSALTGYYNDQCRAYDDMKKYRDNRKLFFGITAGIWTVGMIDMFLWEHLHELMFADGQTLPIRLTATQDRIGVSINFNLGKLP